MYSTTQARTHLEQGIALYDSCKHRSLAYRYGSDSGVACLSYAALAMGILGYADQAWQRSQEALTLAQELSHPFSLEYAPVGPDGGYNIADRVSGASSVLP